MQIIAPFQNNILKRIAGLEDAQKFCFTGGTALSFFYLRHRKSEDLDFFTDIEDFLAPFSALKRQEYLAVKTMCVDAPLEVLGYTPEEFKRSTNTVFGQIIRQTSRSF